ncbi:MAG TPA: hypothetical protein VNL14_22530 [Candidatus Acidoferrales bacterium]|nr:hypothetical protein [Candidatus Acidoferrales bacterium]
MDIEKILMIDGGSLGRRYLLAMLDSLFTVVLYPFAFAMIVSACAHLARCLRRSFRRAA